MTKLKEEWRQIEGYPEYSVSNTGRVKKRLIKKNTLNSNGYYVTKLTNGECVKNYKVHRLVAAAFIEGFEERSIVTHKNGRKDDNRVDNLQLDYRSNITDEDVLFIRTNAKKLGGTMRNIDLARKYGVTHVAMLKIVNGTNRK